MIPESFGEGGEVGVPGEAWGGMSGLLMGYPSVLDGKQQMAQKGKN